MNNFVNVTPEEVKPKNDWRGKPFETDHLYWWTDDGYVSQADAVVYLNSIFGNAEEVRKYGG